MTTTPNLSPKTLEEKLNTLRRAVTTSWLTGVPDFRRHYDAAVLDLLDCETFQDLYPTTQANKTPEPKVQKPLHIDEWLDEPTFPFNESTDYAKFVLTFSRMPAWMNMAFSPWMKQFKLFCTYKGETYRVTGASRMGDVWLNPNLNREHGYQHRVNVEDCSAWRNDPETQVR